MFAEICEQQENGPCVLLFGQRCCLNNGATGRTWAQHCYWTYLGMRTVSMMWTTPFPTFTLPQTTLEFPLTERS